MNNLASLLISILALAISAFTFYFKFLRQAKPIISAAEKIGLWHAHGEFQMDIPITITNEGARVGYIYQMGLIIENYHNVEERYFLKWELFQKLNLSKGTWEADELASLISVPEKTTINKYVRFRSDNSMKDWLPGLGKYVVYVLGWSRKGDIPNIYDNFELNTDDQMRNNLRQNMEADKLVTTYYIRNDWGKWTPKRLSSVEFKNLTKNLRQ